MKALIVAVVFLFSSAATAGSWSTYQGNSDHTGYVPVSLAPLAAPPLRWESHPYVSGARTGGVAIGAGRVFVTPAWVFTGSTALVSLDLESGQERWRLDFGNVFSVNPPALDGQGKVYLATGNHTPQTFLRAYDSESGAFRWRTAMAAQWERYMAPTIVGNQIASNGGYYGGMYAFDPASGDSDYYARLPQCDQMTPVPWRESWVTLTNRIDVIDRETGVARSIAIPDGSTGCASGQTPIVLGDTAYFTHRGHLLAMNLTDGSTVFDRDIAAAGQVSSDGSRLYFATAGVVSVYDLQGNVVSRLAFPGHELSAPLIVTRSHVIASIASADNTAILDLAGQQPPVLLGHGGAMGLVNDMLVVGANDGVYAYQVSEALFADDFDGE